MDRPTDVAGIAGLAVRLIGPCLRCVGIAAVGALLAGCSSRTVIEELPLAPVYLSENDSVVILSRRTSAQYEAKDTFISCVGNNLNREVRIIPEKEFIDGMYPWFEALTAPSNVEQLADLLQNPSVARKIASYGVRYLVWIDGYKETVNQTGSMSCTITPGGAGCLGFAAWDDEANYEASIWDFRDLTLAVRISSETSGTNYMPAVVVPIPLLARVQANACNALSNSIARHFEFTDPNTLAADAVPQS